MKFMFGVEFEGACDVYFRWLASELPRCPQGPIFTGIGADRSGASVDRRRTRGLGVMGRRCIWAVRISGGVSVPMKHLGTLTR